MHLTNNRCGWIDQPTGQARKLLPFRGLTASGLLFPVVRDRDEHRALECFLRGKVALQWPCLAVRWLLSFVRHIRIIVSFGRRVTLNFPQHSIVEKCAMVDDKFIYGAPRLGSFGFDHTVMRIVLVEGGSLARPHSSILAGTPLCTNNSNTLRPDLTEASSLPHPIVIPSSPKSGTDVSINRSVCQPVKRNHISKENTVRCAPGSAVLLSSTLAFGADDKPLISAPKSPRSIGWFAFSKSIRLACAVASLVLVSSTCFSSIRLFDSTFAAVNLARPASLRASPAALFSCATSRSAIVCKWALYAKTPPSAISSPATPMITKTSKKRLCFLNRGYSLFLWSAKYSPTRPATSMMPNSNNANSDAASSAVVRDFDKEKIPIQLHTLIGALGFMVQGLCALLIVFARLRRR
jgi:hypothetical protein